MPIVCHSHIHITRLRFPFAARVEALQGRASLRDANARREVWPDSPFVVPAFAYFDCHLPATVGQPCTIMLTAMHTQTTGAGKQWSRALARLVFEHPCMAWNAALVSEQWQVTPKQVRARLFSEGEALHSLVREQRAALAFYALTRSDVSTRGLPAQLDMLARHAGMDSTATFVRTCVDLFGTDPHELAATNCPPVLSEVSIGTASVSDWTQSVTNSRR